MHVCRELSDALAALHAKGLVHRDVKPSNILLETPENGQDALLARPVLVDFGLLRFAGDTDLTGTRTLLGTPAYSSPESQLGRPIDARADVFSLGATLHDLLTLTPPGTRGLATAGLPRVCDVNPLVDRRLEAIVAMALMERRELRYENGGAFRDELDRYLRDEPIHALPSRAFGRAMLAARRNPAAAARRTGLALVALVLVACGALYAQFALRLTNAASRARTLELQGDFFGAAQTYADLLAAEGRIALVPWLTDDLARAHEHADGPLFSILEHRRSADLAERSSDPQTATVELQAAGNALCARLFDERRRDLFDYVQRILLREANVGGPSGEIRRKVAFDTWANYLSVADPQHVPEGLIAVLEEVLFGPGKNQVSAETRRSALCAFAAIHGREIFEALIDLFDDEDPVVAQRAVQASVNNWTWLHVHRDWVVDCMPAEVVRRWLEKTWSTRARLSAEDFDQDFDGGFMLRPLKKQFYQAVLEQIAWWEQRPEDDAEEGRAMCLSLLGVPDQEELEAGLDEARTTWARMWRDHRADLKEAPLREVGPSDLSRCQIVSGRQVAAPYTSEIWRPILEDAPVRWSATPVEPVPLSGKVDFETHAPGKEELDEPLPPDLSGSVLRVIAEGARLELIEVHTACFLLLDRPGRSAVTVHSAVPERAKRLEVKIKLAAAARSTVRDFGSGTFLLRAGNTEARFPVDTDADNSTLLLSIGSGELRTRSEIEIVLSCLQGNTTFRLYTIDLTWFRGEE
ncbi:MAG: hypothetical protein Fur0037_21930 [Planctomycetota bacterium]